MAFFIHSRISGLKTPGRDRKILYFTAKSHYNSIFGFLEARAPPGGPDTPVSSKSFNIDAEKTLNTLRLLKKLQMRGPYSDRGARNEAYFAGTPQ